VSQWVADVIYRHRRLLTAFILIGAALLAPRANITRIDNDLTAWFSRSDPVYREYERFRDQFGGTRNLIVALKAPSRERLFSRDLFDTLDAISRDIEQVPAVERVSSLATANVVDIRPGATADPRRSAGARSTTRCFAVISSPRMAPSRPWWSSSTSAGSMTSAHRHSPRYAGS
jgi:predicted RND superfamily exporter protein